ncbi:MAG: fused DSP-PTPase phosphatase/NAD kinase-like protein [Methyloligellaceae bacterium]
MRAIKRALRRGITRPAGQKIDQWRKNVLNVSPSWAHRPLNLTIDYLDMIFVDHGIFRIFYANRHQISDGVWRASQPWPHQVRYYAKKGIRTIVNLRGVRNCGSYRLEVDACKKHGVRLVDFKLRSREAPQREMIERFEEFFNDLDYPILIHCKSGADRAGLASALFLFLNKHASLRSSQRQLHFRFGHFRHAETGILDHFFDQYSKYDKANPTSFHEWVDRVYDPEDLKSTFRSGYWPNLLVNKILRRE